MPKPHEVSKQAKLRKSVRVIFTVVLWIAIIWYSMFVLATSESRPFFVPEHRNLAFELRKCQLRIRAHSSPCDGSWRDCKDMSAPPSGKISVHHYLPMPWNAGAEFNAFKWEETTPDNDDDPYTFTLHNDFKSGATTSCLVHVEVNNQAVLGNISILCLEECIVVMDTTDLEQDLGLDSGVIWRAWETGSFNINASTVTTESTVRLSGVEFESLNITLGVGDVFLEDVAVNADSEVIANEGDVYIQARQDLRVQWSDSTSYYCLAAPVQPVPDLEYGCNVSNYTNTTGSCTGSVQLCGNQTVCDNGIEWEYLERGPGPEGSPAGQRERLVRYYRPLLDLKVPQGSFYVTRSKIRSARRLYSSRGFAFEEANGSLTFNDKTMNSLADAKEVLSNSVTSGRVYTWMGPTNARMARPGVSFLFALLPSEAYACLKPWWLSWISPLLLNSQQVYNEQIKFRTGPCPYESVIDPISLSEVSSLINEAGPTQSYKVAYMLNSNYALGSRAFRFQATRSFGQQFQENFPFITFTEDTWIFNTTAYAATEKVNLMSNPPLAMAFVISMVIGFTVAGGALWLAWRVISQLVHVFLQSSKHINGYSRVYGGVQDDDNAPLSARNTRPLSFEDHDDIDNREDEADETDEGESDSEEEEEEDDGGGRKAKKKNLVLDWTSKVGSAAKKVTKEVGSAGKKISGMGNIDETDAELQRENQQREDEQDKRAGVDPMAVVFGKVKLIKFHELPPLFGIIDHMFIMLSKRKADSLSRFMQLRSIKETQGVKDDSARDEDSDSDESQTDPFIKENNEQPYWSGTTLTKFKNVYSKYCFLAGLSEENLSRRQKSYDCLSRYGFKLEQLPPTDQQDAFIKVRFKTQRELEWELSRGRPRQQPGESSLDFFLRAQCKQTNFDSDNIEVDHFKSEYTLFCEQFRIQSVVTVSKALMQHRLGIMSTKLPAYQILPKKPAGEGSFKLDMALAERHVDNMCRKNIGIVGNVTFSGWGVFLIDLGISLFHFTVIIITFCPLNFFILFLSTAYSDYSTADLAYVWRFSDFSAYPSKIWNLIPAYPLFLFVTIPGVISILILYCELLLYYYEQPFPLDTLLYFEKMRQKSKGITSWKQFKKLIFSKRSIWWRLKYVWWLLRFAVHIYQWCALIVIMYIVAFFGALMAVWCVLAAMINPDAFLTYSTGLITLISFVMGKYAVLKKLWRKSLDEILKLFQEMIQEKINFAIQKMVEVSTAYVSDIGGKALDAVGDVVGGIGGEAAQAQFQQHVMMLGGSTLGRNITSSGFDIDTVVRLASGDKAAFAAFAEERGVPVEIIDVMLGIAEGDPDKIVKAIGEILRKYQHLSRLAPELAIALAELALTPSKPKAEKFSKAIFQHCLPMVLKLWAKEGTSSDDKETGKGESEVNALMVQLKKLKDEHPDLPIEAIVTAMEMEGQQRDANLRKIVELSADPEAGGAILSQLKGMAADPKLAQLLKDEIRHLASTGNIAKIGAIVGDQLGLSPRTQSATTNLLLDVLPPFLKGLVSLVKRDYHEFVVSLVYVHNTMSDNRAFLESRLGASKFKNFERIRPILNMLDILMRTGSIQDSIFHILEDEHVLGLTPEVTKFTKFMLWLRPLKQDVLKAAKNPMQADFLCSWSSRIKVIKVAADFFQIHPDFIILIEIMVAFAIEDMRALAHEDVGKRLARCCMALINKSHLKVFKTAASRDMLAELFSMAMTLLVSLQAGMAGDMFTQLQDRTGIDRLKMSEVRELFLHKVVPTAAPPKGMPKWQLIQAAANFVGLESSEAVGLAHLCFGHTHTSETTTFLREIMRRQGVVPVGLDRFLKNLLAIQFHASDESLMVALQELQVRHRFTSIIGFHRAPPRYFSEEMLMSVGIDHPEVLQARHEVPFSYDDHPALWKEWLNKASLNIQKRDIGEWQHVNPQRVKRRVAFQDEPSVSNNHPDLEGSFGSRPATSGGHQNPSDGHALGASGGLGASGALGSTLRGDVLGKVRPPSNNKPQHSNEDDAVKTATTVSQLLADADLRGLKGAEGAKARQALRRQASQIRQTKKEEHRSKHVAHNVRTFHKHHTSTTQISGTPQLTGDNQVLVEQAETKDRFQVLQLNWCTQPLTANLLRFIINYYNDMLKHHYPQLTDEVNAAHSQAEKMVSRAFVGVANTGGKFVKGVGGALASAAKGGGAHGAGGLAAAAKATDIQSDYTESLATRKLLNLQDTSTGVLHPFRMPKNEELEVLIKILDIKTIVHGVSAAGAGKGKRAIVVQNLADMIGVDASRMSTFFDLMAPERTQDARKAVETIGKQFLPDHETHAIAEVAYTIKRAVSVFDDLRSKLWEVAHRFRLPRFLTTASLLPNLSYPPHMREIGSIAHFFLQPILLTPQMDSRAQLVLYNLMGLAAGSPPNSNLLAEVFGISSSRDSFPVTLVRILMRTNMTDKLQLLPTVVHKFLEKIPSDDLKNKFNEVFPFLLFFCGFPFAELPQDMDPNAPIIGNVFDFIKNRTGISLWVLEGIDLSQWSISPFSSSDENTFDSGSVLGLLLPMFQSARVSFSMQDYVPSDGIVKAIVSLAHCRTENLEYLAEALRLDTFFVQLLVQLVDLNRKADDQAHITQVMQSIRMNAGITKQLAALGLPQEKFLSLLTMSFPDMEEVATLPGLLEKLGLARLGVDRTVVEFLYSAVSCGLLHLRGVYDTARHEASTSVLSNILEPIVEHVGFHNVLVPLTALRLFQGDFHIVERDDAHLKMLLPSKLERECTMAVSGLLSYEPPPFTYHPYVASGLKSFKIVERRVDPKLAMRSVMFEEMCKEHSKMGLWIGDADPTDEMKAYWERLVPEAAEQDIEIVSETFLPFPADFVFEIYSEEDGTRLYAPFDLFDQDGQRFPNQFEIQGVDPLVDAERKKAFNLRIRALTAVRGTFYLYWRAHRKVENRQHYHEQRANTARSGVRELEKISWYRRLHWGGVAEVWWDCFDVHPLFLMLAEGNVSAIHLAADLLGVPSVMLAFLLAHVTTAPPQSLRPLLLADLCIEPLVKRAVYHLLRGKDPGVGPEACMQPPDDMFDRLRPAPLVGHPEPADKIPDEAGTGYVQDVEDDGRSVSPLFGFSEGIGTKEGFFPGNNRHMSKTSTLESERSTVKSERPTSSHGQKLQGDDDNSSEHEIGVGDIDEDEKKFSYSVQRADSPEEDEIFTDGQLGGMGYSYSQPSSNNDEPDEFYAWLYGIDLGQYPDELGEIFNAEVSEDSFHLGRMLSTAGQKKVDLMWETIAIQYLEDLKEQSRQRGVLDDWIQVWSLIPNNLHLLLSLWLVQLYGILDQDDKQNNSISQMVSLAPNVSLMVSLSKVIQGRRAAASIVHRKGKVLGAEQLQAYLMPAMWGLEVYIRTGNKNYRKDLRQDLQNIAENSPLDDGGDEFKWVKGGIWNFELPELLKQVARHEVDFMPGTSAYWHWQDWDWPCDGIAKMLCRVAQVARLAVGVAEPICCWHPNDVEHSLRLAMTTAHKFQVYRADSAFTKVLIRRGWGTTLKINDKDKDKDDKEKSFSEAKSSSFVRKASSKKDQGRKMMCLTQNELKEDLCDGLALAVLWALVAGGANPNIATYSYKKLKWGRMNVKDTKLISTYIHIYAAVASLVSTPFGSQASRPKLMCSTGQAFRCLLENPRRLGNRRISIWSQTLSAELGLDHQSLEVLVHVAHGFVQSEKGKLLSPVVMEALATRLRMPKGSVQILQSICTKGWSVEASEVLARRLKVPAQVVHALILASKGDVDGWIRLHKCLFRQEIQKHTKKSQQDLHEEQLDWEQRLFEACIMFSNMGRQDRRGNTTQQLGWLSRVLDLLLPLLTESAYDRGFPRKGSGGLAAWTEWSADHKDKMKDGASNVLSGAISFGSGAVSHTTKCSRHVASMVGQVASAFVPDKLEDAAANMAHTATTFKPKVNVDTDVVTSKFGGAVAKIGDVANSLGFKKNNIDMEEAGRIAREFDLLKRTLAFVLHILSGHCSAAGELLATTETLWRAAGFGENSKSYFRDFTYLVKNSGEVSFKDILSTGNKMVENLAKPLSAFVIKVDKRKPTWHSSAGMGDTGGPGAFPKSMDSWECDVCHSWNPEKRFDPLTHKKLTREGFNDAYRDEAQEQWNAAKRVHGDRCEICHRRDVLEKRMKGLLTCMFGMVSKDNKVVLRSIRKVMVDSIVGLLENNKDLSIKKYLLKDENTGELYLSNLAVGEVNQDVVQSMIRHSSMRAAIMVQSLRAFIKMREDKDSMGKKNSNASSGFFSLNKMAQAMHGQTATSVTSHLRNLFSKAHRLDLLKEKRLNRAVFREMLTDEHLLTVVKALGIKAMALEEILDALSNSDGTIDVQRFFNELPRMKDTGEGRSAGLYIEGHRLKTAELRKLATEDALLSARKHLLEVGDEVLAKRPQHRGEIVDPWLAGTVLAIEPALRRCNIQFQDGQVSKDVLEHEVYYLPHRSDDARYTMLPEEAQPVKFSTSTSVGIGGTSPTDADSRPFTIDADSRPKTTERVSLQVLDLQSRVEEEEDLHRQIAQQNQLLKQQMMKLSRHGHLDDEELPPLDVLSISDRTPEPRPNRTGALASTLDAPPGATAISPPGIPEAPKAWPSPSRRGSKQLAHVMMQRDKTETEAFNAMCHFFIGVACSTVNGFKAAHQDEMVAFLTELQNSFLPILAAAATGRFEQVLCLLKDLAINLVSDADPQLAELAENVQFALDLLTLVGVDKTLVRELMPLDGSGGKFLEVFIKRLARYACDKFVSVGQRNELMDLVDQLVRLLVVLCVDSNPADILTQLDMLIQPLKRFLLNLIDDDNIVSAAERLLDSVWEIARDAPGLKVSEYVDLFSEGEDGKPPPAIVIMGALKDLLLPFMPEEMHQPLLDVLRVLSELSQLSADPTPLGFKSRTPIIIEKMASVLSVPKHNVSGIIALAKGDWAGAADLCRPFCNIDTDVFDAMTQLLPTVQKTIVKSKDTHTSGEEMAELAESNSSIATRVQQIAAAAAKNEAVVKDLFDLVDIDKNGTITIEELELVMKRLGFKLTHHRLLEILSACKKKKDKGAITTAEDADGLTLEEFESSLLYLTKKVAWNSMEEMLVSWPRLLAYLVFFTFLLALTMAFIGLGVNAFVTGGTFSAIVNSSLTVVAGLSMSRAKAGQGESTGGEPDVVKSMLADVSSTVMGES